MTLDCTCNRLKEAEAKAAKWDALVRCGECEYYRDHELIPIENAPDLCMRIPYGVNVEPDGFCAWGERRES